MNKITEEELKNLMEISNEYSKLGLEILNIELSIHNLNEFKKNLIEQSLEMKKKEDEYTELLFQKYGNIKIDINSGEITNNQ